jgi:hypothetical protein
MTEVFTAKVLSRMHALFSSEVQSILCDKKDASTVVAEL